MSSEKINEIPKIDFRLMEEKIQQTFSDFEQKVLEVFQSAIEPEERANFVEKYGLILSSFTELKDKIIKRFGYAGENHSLQQADFKNGLADLEKIFLTLINVLESDYGQQGDYDVTNNAQDGQLVSSIIKHRKGEDTTLVFNFKEKLQHEARVDVQHIDQQGNKYSLRFDLDKRQGGVTCDVQSKNLDKIFYHVGDQGGEGHHFRMEALTKFVFEEGIEKKTESFELVVKKFKEFLMEALKAEQATLEDLIRKFNER